MFGMRTSPVFAHLDLDAFFVSVERLDDPSLAGRPVIVGGADPRARGAVACASYEARARGVRSGMALRRAFALCPAARFLAPRPERYLACSRAVRELLAARVPRLVQRSIDEFAIDLTGCERLLGRPEEVVRRLGDVVEEHAGITCSTGLAATPLVAKVAAGQGKPRGRVVVPRGEEADFLAPLPLRALPGVGPRSEERLQELGLRTVGDLAAIPEEALREAFGAHGATLARRARGGEARLPAPAAGAPWEPREAAPTDAAFGRRFPRSLSREHTFSVDQDAREVLDRALVRLVEAAVAALRAHGLRARSLTVHARFADLRVQRRSGRLPHEAEEREVLALARRLLERLLRRRLRVRRLGVRLQGLAPRLHQASLFEGPQFRSARALGEALDRIRARHGWAAVRLGSGEPE
ncbi:MAG: DNA polymerase IV [Planctomycetota bacterium]|nr:MAG: DNA polymerase IV [Planctomycetota bacterium]